MQFSLFQNSDAIEVIALFTNVFSASEGEEEGRNLGNLVSDLIEKTKASEIIGCVAKDDNIIIGCIFFSRFIVPSNQITYILSPVAIETAFQGAGIGQQLIRYGLEYLKSQKVNLVFTYGSPAFYSKTGFKQISEQIVKAPFILSQPQGWLAQSLDSEPIQVMNGASRCVEALSDQKYW